MENLSIKLLDALFDLCDGENYAILDTDDLSAASPDLVFESEELTEILQSLAVEGFIDLKYADGADFCVAMKTKGRTLIKQSREKLQQILQENALHDAPDMIEGEGTTNAELRADEPANATQPQRRKPQRRQPVSVASDDDLLSADPTEKEMRLEDYAPVESEEDKEKKEKSRVRRTFLGALLGALAGSLVMDLIFLVILLVTLRG